MAEEKTEQAVPSVEGLTPLAAYAQVAHEMYLAMAEAGFEPEDALTMTMNLLPDWVFPIPEEDWDEEEDDYEEEED